MTQDRILSFLLFQRGKFDFELYKELYWVPYGSLRTGISNALNLNSKISPYKPFIIITTTTL